MKKQVKIIALILVVAVALVGAGYAAWGTAITSTTSLRTGEWKIVLENDSDSSYWAGDSIGEFQRTGAFGAIGTTEWSDVSTVTDDYNVTEDLAPETPTDYVYVMAPQPEIPQGSIADSAAQGATACSFSFYNLHPGTRAYTRFEVRNDGSIPAQIADVKVRIKNVETADLCVVDAMMVNPVFGIHHGTGGTDELINATNVSLWDLESTLKTALVGKVLDCDNTLYSYTAGSDELDTGDDIDLESSFCFELPASALGGNVGMNVGFQVEIEIDFVQYNQDLGLES